MESIIGALYVSDGFTLDGAQKFFERVLEPFYDRYITLKTLSHHPTKILFELLQSHGCQQFELVKERNDLTQQTRCDCKSFIPTTGYCAYVCDTQVSCIKLPWPAPWPPQRRLRGVRHLCRHWMHCSATLSSYQERVIVGKADGQTQGLKHELRGCSWRR